MLFVNYQEMAYRIARTYKRNPYFESHEYRAIVQKQSEIRVLVKPLQTPTIKNKYDM